MRNAQRIIRIKITGQLEISTFARLLWELFKALIYGVLDSLKPDFASELVEYIKNKINQTITEFLEKALQLDEDYLHSENVALASGEL